MGYSPAAEAGRKIHGPGWKKTIRGIPALNRAAYAAIEDADHDKVVECMRAIGRKFRMYYDANSPHARWNEEEAIEWFEEESPNWWFEEGEIDGFQSEWNHRLSELYDWADFNRVWVEPDLGRE